MKTNRNDRPEPTLGWIACLLAVAALLLVTPACGGPAGGPEATTEVDEAEKAYARLVNAQGGIVGSAVLTEAEGGVRVQLTADNLPPGSYSVQIHEAGFCEPPGFLSAGEPFPPPEEVGMVESMAQPLNRSIAELRIMNNGAAEVDAIAPVVTLRAGDNSLFHPGGTALVIDNRSPSGTYEGRVACGVITQTEGEVVEGVTPGDLETGRHPDEDGIPGKEHRQPQTDQ